MKICCHVISICLAFSTLCLAQPPKTMEMQLMTSNNQHNPHSDESPQSAYKRLIDPAEDPYGADSASGPGNPQPQVSLIQELAIFLRFFRSCCPWYGIPEVD